MGSRKPVVRATVFIESAQKPKDLVAAVDLAENLPAVGAPTGGGRHMDPAKASTTSVAKAESDGRVWVYPVAQHLMKHDKRTIRVRGKDVKVDFSTAKKKEKAR